MTLYSTCIQHEMPQPLIIFVVSFTKETPNFGTFGSVSHPPRELFFIILLFNSVYAHV